MIRTLTLALLLAAPAAAREPLQPRVETVLREVGPGPRFGLVVTDETGREVVAIDPDGRYMPASNTKMYSTAAAFANLGGLDQPDATGGAAVRLEGRDVVLVGHGDARLSSADDCATDCLATLADAVAAKTRRVRDVVGDDTTFPDERWSLGMSWNNIPTRSGTGISALTLDDNEWVLSVSPGPAAGAPATITGPAYLTLDNRTTTVAGGETAIAYDRQPNADTVRITGTIALGAAPQPVRLGIDDPAHYAASRLKTLLEARGVRVTGAVRARHRLPVDSDDPTKRGTAPVVRPPEPPILAQLTPPPLIEDLTLTNKVSQNLHAELFLRRVALAHGSGSVADGLAAVGTMLTAAGAPRRGWDFSDGSGMSTYNRVSPRTSVALLRWIAHQPWGTAWRATLPIAGTDGTLASRFVGSPLQGRLFAKTGTINATNALAGYLTAASGATLTFAAYANDVPADVRATAVVDKALLLIAAEN